MNYSKLIKKSLRSKTLLQDVFGFALIKLGFADKYLAGQVTMYKSYNWIKRHFQKELDYIVAETGNRNKRELAEKKVWICWLQGIENAPKIVQECYKSIKYWLKEWKVIVITAENYDEFAKLPQYIIEKWENGIISNTHFSDLLRLELLIKHGGLWLDATTFLTGSLPEYVTRNELFVYRNGWMNMEMINMASWLIYSKYTNNNLLAETQSLLYKYWKKYDYLKNYFLLHIFFRMVTDKHQEEWEKVPMVNHVDSHLLINELSKPYDAKRCSEIMKLTSVHKLTYKIENSEGSVEEKLDDLLENSTVIRR